MQQRYDFLLRKFSKVSITLETSGTHGTAWLEDIEEPDLFRG